MTRVPVAVIAALAALSLIPPAALAAGLPTFKTTLIVPDKSLGGIALKSSLVAAKRAFRSGGSACAVRTGCRFTGPGEATFSVQFAATTTKSPPFVGEISISAGEKASGTKETLVIPPSLSALKTASGIGLGSTAKQVKAAYPRAAGSAHDGYFVIRGGGELATTFSLVDGLVSAITMQAVHFG